MGSEYLCRRCGSKQDEITCGDCETTVCVVCYDRCRRCEKPLCDKHFERSEGRGGLCDGCLSVRRTYLDEGQRVFEAQRETAENAGDAELARIFKRARTILKDLERWSALLERRRVELETMPDVRAQDLTRQLQELQQEEVKLHAARRAAEDAAAAKSRFVAHVSHEIRTPMNAVVAMADLLSETSLDEQQRKYLNTIRHSGDHLVRIVGDILDYSKLEAGRLSIESVPFDLEATLAGVIEIMAPRALEKGIPVVFRYAPGAARRVVGDAARISQVIMNLVSNAIKFTHSGNVIVFVDQLGFAQERAVMRITVLDTGIGIPKDKYPAIFEQFEQANAGTYREYGGTGLGLAITNQLVLLMGGQVGLTSREGNGSRFRVTLAMPVVDEQTPEGISAVLAGQRILVADPNPTSAEFLVAQAQHLGARAETLADRAKIMERLVVAQEEKDSFDAVWLHHMPPYLDAASLGTAIRQSELIPRTMLVCFSSAGTIEQRQKFEALEFTAYFHGPCLAKDIVRTLTDAQQSFSTAENGGMLAFSSQSTPDDADAAMKPAEPNLRSYRVLVVDDRPVNQEVATAIFDQLGCDLTMVTSGEDAVQMCSSDTFDIVFMDCQMPVMDGYEATRRIRRGAGPCSTVPIVAMTAEVAEGYRERCLQAGMNDYIPKPATRQHIMSAMQRWLNPPTRSVAAVPMPVAAEATAHVLDRDRALANLGGRAEILTRVTDVFLETVPTEAASLGRVLRDGNYKEVERLAHSIKTAAGSLGGTRVSRIAERLERAAHEGNLALASKLHPEFDEEFAALVRELGRIEWSGLHQAK